MSQSIAFGSCHKVNDPNSDVILTSIADKNPDALSGLGILFMGKMGTPNTSANDLISSNQKTYQKLRQTTSVYGTWDDHDYGLNNAGRDYQHKNRSRADLFAFLDVPKNNPAYQRTGAYQSYDISPNVKLILLDNRYFKSEYAPKAYNDPYPLTRKEQSSRRTMALARTTPPKFNCQHTYYRIGIQVLSPNHRFEKWLNYPNEYQRLIQLLQTYQTKTPLCSLVIDICQNSPKKRSDTAPFTMQLQVE